MKKVYYAVAKGRKPGIYNTWEECKMQIDGFAGASFKKFKNKEDAINFVNNKEVESDAFDHNDILELLDKGYAVAYTDGSFDEELNYYSYGIVLFLPGNLKPLYFSRALKDKKYIEFRNVSGEIFAALRAIDLAVSNDLKNIMICHDYIGVEKWLTREWKTNTNISKHYLEEYQEKYEGKINVEFKHVKAHTGDLYNEKADELAFNAIAKIKRLTLIDEEF